MVLIVIVRDVAAVVVLFAIVVDIVDCFFLF